MEEWGKISEERDLINKTKYKYFTVTFAEYLWKILYKLNFWIRY